MIRSAQSKFQLGQLLATPGAVEALQSAGQDALAFIRRHSSGDWGDLSCDDQQANEDALCHGGRIFSAYHTRLNTKLWIITEQDRSATTVLLPGRVLSHSVPLHDQPRSR